MRIGVISDTHGILRPEAVAALVDVEAILHAGDVGDPMILDRLNALAPTTAIRGNVDTSGLCAQLPATEMGEFGGKLIYMLHAIQDLDINPAAASVSLVISGHSHRPSVEERNGVVYLNPGSAGPRRFSLPITLAIVEIGDEIDARIVEL